MMTWLGIAFMCLFFPENEPDPWPAPPIAPGEPTGDPTWWAAKLEYDLSFAAPELWPMKMALRFEQAMDAARQDPPIAPEVGGHPMTPPAEPRTAAGRALNALEGWDWAGLPNEEVLDRILAIEAEAAAPQREALEAVAPFLHNWWPVENYPTQRVRDLVDAALAAHVEPGGNE